MYLKMAMSSSLNSMFSMYRIGFAKDIHRLVANKKLMLAGIHIPFIKGEEAHSDGDVVIHALSEAMLGALSLGDLGKHFPTNDERYENIESSKILLAVNMMVKEKGFHIVNADISIEIEKPKLSQHIIKMRKRLADLLKINIEQISIKANTNEGLGDIGNGKAVIAYAIVLLEKVLK